MNQQTHLYRSISLENSIKQLKHCLALAIREIKQSATCPVFYFTYSTRGNALTNTYTLYLYILLVINCLYILECSKSLRPFHVYLDPFHVYLDPFHVYKFTCVLIDLNNKQ